MRPTSTHDLLQRFKTHPLVRGILARERVAWCQGLPGGGYWSMPSSRCWGGARRRRGGMVDTVALKGVHHSVMSAKLGRRGRSTARSRARIELASYEQAIASRCGQGLYEVRNTASRSRKASCRAPHWST